jgi:hypothetical protein
MLEEPGKKLLSKTLVIGNCGEMLGNVNKPHTSVEEGE